MHRPRRPERSTLLLALGLLAAGSPAPAGAQTSPLSVRGSGGGSFAAGGFREPAAFPGGVGSGPSFGVHFDYRIGSRGGAYLGFSQHRFACEDVGCPGAGEYVLTGWDLGARLALTAAGVRPWVQLGAVFARVERDFEVGGRAERKVSDLSAGAEGGLGVTIPLRGRVRLEPAARYVWLDTRFPGEGLLRMRYAVTDVALVVAF